MCRLPLVFAHPPLAYPPTPPDAGRPALYALCSRPDAFGVIQAFVGVLMSLVACAFVFIRAAPHGGSGGGLESAQGAGRGGAGKSFDLEPTVLNSAYSALLAVTTVG